MADWTFIPDSSVDPDAPLTSDLAYAWRDNPIAIAEGAPGAPMIRDVALHASDVNYNGILFISNRLIASGGDWGGMYVWGVKLSTGQVYIGDVVPGSEIGSVGPGGYVTPGSWRSAGYSPGDGLTASLWQRIA